MIVDDVFTRTLMKWLVVLLGFFVSALGAFFQLSSLSAIENLGLCLSWSNGHPIGCMKTLL